MYKLLDGKSYSLVLKEKLNLVFKNIANENIPTLGILQVGNLEESNIYIKHKITMANSLGIKAEFIKLHENANYDEIANGIKRLSNTTNGLIIQLPMQTTNLTSDEKNKLLNLIPNEKDIDGLNDFNLNSKYTNNNFLPATAKGIILLLKKYDIAIDNQNIANVTQNSLRGNISMIPQEPVLFHRSIRDNIAYGKPNATEQEIIAASKMARCHEFI